jgi:hypothetical protein
MQKFRPEKQDSAGRARSASTRPRETNDDLAFSSFLVRQCLPF